MRALRSATAAALAVALVMPAAMTFAIVIPDITLTLTNPDSNSNTVSVTISLTPNGLSEQTQTKSATITGGCSTTFGAVFDPISHQATIPELTFNLQQPGQIALQDTSFAFSWFFGFANESVDTSGVMLSPFTPMPPTPVSGGLFDASQQSAEFNSGSLVYSGVTSGTQDLAATPLGGPNGATSAAAVAISAPTMHGNVATYTATVTLPLSLEQTISGSGYTAGLAASGTLQASGTFQFDFSPRVVSWNASSGDFSAGSNWDVGFAPRTGDTAAIENGGASTLSTAFSGTPAAVWVGNGASTSGTLTVAAGGSLNCGALVLGENGGTGTLIVTDNDSLPASGSLTIGAGGTLILDPAWAMAPANDATSAAPTMSAVPEPGTLALLAVALFGTALHQCVRSFAASAKAASP